MTQARMMLHVSSQSLQASADTYFNDHTLFILDETSGLAANPDVETQEVSNHKFPLWTEDFPQGVLLQAGSEEENLSFGLAG